MPVIRKLRKKGDESRIFEQEVGERSDLVADEEDVVIGPSRRVGTGIELEEGRAEDWRARKMDSATLTE